MAVSRATDADAERQADNLALAAQQLGQRIEQLERAISTAGAGASGAMPPEKAAAASTSSANSDGIEQKKAAMASALSDLRSRQLQDWGEAEKLYQRAITASPDTAMLHVKRARALVALGKADQEAAEVRSAVALEPKNALYVAELGDALYDRKDWDGAEAQYKEAIRLEPENALFHFDLGSVYVEKKNWPTAEAEAKQAVTLEPGNEMYQRLYDKLQARQEKNDH